MRVPFACLALLSFTDWQPLGPSRPFFTSVHACFLCMIGTAVLCRLALLDSSRPSSATLHLYPLFMTSTAVLQTAGP